LPFAFPTHVTPRHSDTWLARLRRLACGVLAMPPWLAWGPPAREWGWHIAPFGVQYFGESSEQGMGGLIEMQLPTLSSTKSAQYTL